MRSGCQRAVNQLTENTIANCMHVQLAAIRHSRQAHEARRTHSAACLSRGAARARALSAEPLAFLRLLNRLWGAIKNFMASPKSHSFTRPRCRRSTYLLFIIHAHLTAAHIFALFFSSAKFTNALRALVKKSWFTFKRPKCVYKWFAEDR